MLFLHVKNYAEIDVHKNTGISCQGAGAQRGEQQRLRRCGRQTDRQANRQAGRKEGKVLGKCLPRALGFPMYSK